MTIVMLVIMTETTADILAVGEVVGRPADGKTVANGLRADCLSTAVSGGLLNGFSGQRLRPERRPGRASPASRAGSSSRPAAGSWWCSGCSRRSGRSSPRSRRRCSAAPGWRCSPRSPPAASARWARVNYEGNNNLIIVALSIGMGVIPIAVPTFYEQFPSWFQTVFDSGISSAAVTAVLLNMLFNVGRNGRADGGGARRRVADRRGHAGLRRARRGDAPQRRPSTPARRRPSTRRVSAVRTAWLGQRSAGRTRPCAV